MADDWNPTDAELDTICRSACDATTGTLNLIRLVRRLRAQVAGHADHIKAAHDILARQAEKRPALDPAHLYRPCPLCRGTFRVEVDDTGERVTYGACPCVRGAVPGWVRVEHT